MNTQSEGLVIAIVVLAVLLFVPPLRRIFSLLIRLAIFVLAVAIIAAGVTMILNDETIFERPGIGQRVVRFVTMNSAAASSTGSSAVTCDPTKPQGEPAETAPPKRAKKEQESAEPQMTRNVIDNGKPAPLDDVFPELIRRGYPGIPRQELFKLSQDTVNSLGGWRIVKADSNAYTVDCIYTPRYFKLEDDVRITIDPSGDIEVCSRSGLARPDNTSLMRYFPGDLGSNIGHIKEFYEALEPKMDEVYQQEQEKQNAKKPQH
ncbi:MAG: hypothetical protein WBY93_03285 [Candidatus Binatus sp.]